MYHDSHVLRMSMSSSLYDHKCVKCGITDENTEGLQAPCTSPLTWRKRIELSGGDVENLNPTYKGEDISHKSMFSHTLKHGLPKMPFTIVEEAKTDK
jgi:hypothetical protein